MAAARPGYTLYSAVSNIEITPKICKICPGIPYNHNRILMRISALRLCLTLVSTSISLREEREMIVERKCWLEEGPDQDTELTWL